METLHFRPHNAVRTAAALCGAACLLVGIAGASRGAWAAAVVMSAFGTAVLLILRLKWTLHSTGITYITALRRIEIPYNRIIRLDIVRGGGTIEAENGSIPLGWAAHRQHMIEQVVARAELTRRLETPWGVVARYVPRRTAVAFVPHAQRRRPPHNPTN